MKLTITDSKDVAFHLSICENADEDAYLFAIKILEQSIICLNAAKDMRKHDEGATNE